MQWLLIVVAVHYSSDVPARELHDLKIQRFASEAECKSMAEWIKARSTYIIKWTCVHE